jgi:hypothetical protein
MKMKCVFCEVGTWVLSIFKRNLDFQKVNISRIVWSVVSICKNALTLLTMFVCQYWGVFWSCELWRGAVLYVDTNVLEGFRVKTSGLKMEAVCSLPPIKILQLGYQILYIIWTSVGRNSQMLYSYFSSTEIFVSSVLRYSEHIGTFLKLDLFTDSGPHSFRLTRATLTFAEVVQW